MSTSTNAGQPLIVPINIAALPVGSSDLNGPMGDFGTRDFARLSADFSAMPYLDPSGERMNAGANITEDMLPTPFESTSDPLRKGIHLHWALPDALSHGKSNKDGTIEFRDAPNRWLVVRIATNRANPAAPVTAVKAWVVESDYLWDKEQMLRSGANDSGAPNSSGGLLDSADPLDSSNPNGPTQNNASLAVPTEPKLTKVEGQSNKSFRQMGRVFAYETWSEKGGGTYISKHTALGYGTPTYAAAYEHCRNVFGLHDTMTDLDMKAFPPASTRISYLVAGWFSNAASDPLVKLTFPDGLDTLGKIGVVEKAYKWTFGLDPSAPFPTSTICSGLLTGITWNPDNNYIKRRSTDSPIEVAAGNTTAEALSALIASHRKPGDPPEIERVLNALQLNLLTKLGTPDGLAKFEEALHQNDFGMRNVGTIWMVKKGSDAGSSTGAANPCGSSTQGGGSGGSATTGGDLAEAARDLNAPLPQNIADALIKLNGVQAQVDRRAFQIDSLRAQIFVDWYKYMVLEYPSQVSASLLKSGSKATSRPLLGQALPDVNKVFRYIKREVAALTASLTDQGKDEEDLKNKIKSLCVLLGSDYTLSSFASPRSWQPREPVLLFSGDDLRPSYRHGADGRYDPTKKNLLLCRPASSLIGTMTVGGTAYSVTPAALPKLPVPPNGPQAATLTALMGEAFFLDQNQAWTLARAAAAQGGAGNPAVADLNGFVDSVKKKQAELFPTGVPQAQGGGPAISFTGTTPSRVGFDTWSMPWIPLMMQWEVYWYPIAPVDLEGTGTGIYPPDFITSNFNLDIDAIDMVYGGSVPSPLPMPQTYQGTTLLTPNAEIDIRGQIDRYIATNPGGKYADQLKVMRDRMQLAMMAQTLDGLNQAFVMRKQTLQLQVFDPLAASVSYAHDEFSNVLVRNAVGDRNTFAPMPHFSYNPLRAGWMAVHRVRIVDAFGQWRELTDPRVIRSEMLIPANDDPSRPMISLPPRVTQPSRLLFRWLSGASTGDLVESDSDPASSPVCGWVLFNHLDDSLMLYDAAGNALGSLNVQGPLWQGSPGVAGTYGQKIEDALANVNPHLKNFVLGIAGNPNPQAFLDDMLHAIDRTATMVEPGTYMEDQGLAVLIGRPLAVVRASLAMELQGRPAINQSWDAFSDAVARNEVENRNEGGFTKVRFPVRLGDLSQVNDGLIGYFIEGGAATWRTFYAAASTRKANGVVPPTRDQLTVVADGNTAPTVLTMLVDPRATVHATTGILPTKGIGIPPYMYADAMNKMAVTFLTTPVLASITRPAIFAPAENGYTWSWVTNDPATAGTWSVRKDIGTPNSNSAFSQHPQQISEGWLKLSKADGQNGPGEKP